MKLNHRLLITSGLLLAMSTVAMSTATYAWFTTTRQSKVELNTIKIQQDSNLEMEIVSVNGVTAPTSTTGKVYGTGVDKGFKVHDARDTVFAGKSVQDVSGDGATFFKPNIASDGKTFTSVKQVEVDALYNYVNEIVIGFRSDKAYEVYLNSDTSFVETATAVPGQGGATSDNHLSQAARVAFFDRGSANTVAISQSSLKGVIVSDKEAGNKHSFITSADAKDTTIFDGASYKTGYSGFEAIQPNPVPVDDDTIATKTSSNTGLQWYVTKLATAPAQTSGNIQYEGPNGGFIDAYLGYITVRIWVEGTDDQCTGNARYGQFSVKLDFNSYLDA